jgi:alcohol dehydrogenase YqhD (iron-dependent ADH family)
MENFVAYNPTKVLFGKDVEKSVGKKAKEFGKNVLFVYGKGSVIRNGYYNKIKTYLENENLNIVEYSGIKPNPLLDDVEKAAQVCREENIDVIVALGGGSVIDSAKVISVAAKSNKGDAWEIVKRRLEPNGAIPLISILTLAATGTEMNSNAVIQNPAVKEKVGYFHPLMYPKYSYLNPEFTYSVPKNHTVNGVVDLIVHCCEAFFGSGSAPLSDKFALATIKEAIEIAIPVIENPKDYESRARLMWAATNALNGLNLHGKVMGDWGTHQIGHVLSLLFDIAHAETLSIALPAWLKNNKNKLQSKIEEFGKYLFNCEDVDKTIENLESWLKSIGAPTRFSDIGLNETQQNEILNLMLEKSTSGYSIILTDDDRRNIVKLMS